jgi:predicted MFS family arabinose efflux permease
VVLLYATDLQFVLTGFVGLGAGLGGFQLGCGNLVLEFGKREDIPMRVAMAQTADQAVVVVAPILGSLIIETVSYAAMFWTTAGVLSLALAITVLRVQEPRHRRHVDADSTLLG